MTALTQMLVFDMDGVLVDVTESYRETVVKTVEHFTGRPFRAILSKITRTRAAGIMTGCCRKKYAMTWVLMFPTRRSSSTSTISFSIRA